MAQQLAGAVTATVVVLAYVLLVECLTACCVLLAHFIAQGVRELSRMAPTHSVTRELARSSESEVDSSPSPYRLGGHIKW